MKYYIAKKGFPIKGIKAEKIMQLLVEGILTGDDLVFSWKHDVWDTIKDLEIYQMFLNHSETHEMLPGKNLNQNCENSHEIINKLLDKIDQNESLVIDLKSIHDERINNEYGFEIPGLKEDSGSFEEMGTYYDPIGKEDSSSIHHDRTFLDSPNEEKSNTFEQGESDFLESTDFSFANIDVSSQDNLDKSDDDCNNDITKMKYYFKQQTYAIMILLFIYVLFLLCVKFVWFPFNL